MGKTTILEEVGRRLQSTCAFAIFDAWRYQGDALRREFLREVSRQLADQGELPTYDRQAALEELATPISSVRPAGWMFRREQALRALVFSLGVFVLVFLALRLGLDIQTSLLPSAISAIATFSVLLLGSVGQAFDIKYETVTRPRVEDPERFTEKFEDLLGYLKSDRLVIAIDNLDRCAPERIEEVFDTLNTYLEPAGASARAQGLSAKLKRKRESGEKKEAVFIVAADDDALRRHLEAREQNASPAIRPDVGRYADEYLRKIFKASIPIKPLLDADMRSYVDAELKQFVEDRAVAAADRASLVEITSAALKRNPRRVRQFVNNLELRLRLIKTREDSDQIADALSENVLVVAKLTLLEEEWPESYEFVASDPRVLDTWHAQQLEGTLSESGSSPNRGDPAFQAFLNATRGIRSPQLHAYISLKQSVEELSLPGYGDLRDSLIAGDADAVANTLEQADEEMSLRYAQTLLGLLRQEASRGYVDAARSIVERAVAEPKLNQHQSIIGGLLGEAVRNPAVRPQLRLADPGPILAEGQRLPADEFALLVDEFTDLASFKADGDERLGQVVRALAAVVDKLPSRAKPALRESLGRNEVSSAFGEYLPLVERDPSLLPPEAGETAMNAFASDPSAKNPAFSVVRLWLSQDPPATHQDRFASLIAERLIGLGQAGGGSEDERLDAAEMVTVASQLEGVSESGVEAVTTALQQAAANGALAPALMSPSLDLAGSLARHRSDGGDLVDPLVRTLSSQNPDAFIQYATERGEAMAPPLKGQVLPLLGQQVSATRNLDLQRRAAEAILRVVPRDELGVLRAALNECARQDDFDAVDALIESYQSVLGDGLREIVATLLERAQQLGTGGSAPMSLLLKLTELMTADQRSQLRSLIRDALINVASGSGTIAQLEAVVDGSASKKAFATDYELLVREIWDHVKVQPDPQQALLEFVVDRFGRLDDDRRAAVVTQVGNWLTQQPHLRVPLSLLVARIDGLRAREREQLVEKIIEAERLESDPNVRTQMLESAEVVSGRRTTRAWKHLQERFDSLKSGPDADRIVWERLNEKNG